LVLLIGLGVQYTVKTMSGTNICSEAFVVKREALEIKFDLTGVDASGQRVVSQELFDSLLELIEAADDLLVLDMFLVNQFRGFDGGDVHRDMTAELVEALVRKLQTRPGIWLLFVTDPINSVYAERCPADLLPVVQAGGRVVTTDLAQLPDSNYLYSPFFRALEPLLKRVGFMRRPLVGHPFDRRGPEVSVLQMLRLLNFKANHRKVAVCRDAQGHWRGLVSSGNPHTASSAHGNVGLVLRDSAAVGAILKSELEIARATALRTPALCYSQAGTYALLRELEDWLGRVPTASEVSSVAEETPGVLVQYCTEKRIGEKADWILQGVGEGDELDLMMFYLSDAAILRQLRTAALRGAVVRLLLDPNKDAFGRQKNGIPNRVYGTELMRWAAREGVNLQVRWVATHGEQAHFKLMRLHNASSGREQLLVGSANFTTRNLRGCNLESALYCEDALPQGEKCEKVFERLWANSSGVIYSVGFERYASRGIISWLRKGVTVVGNQTGFCTY
jgi:hypothetical protein